MFAAMPVSSEWRTTHSRSQLIFTEGGRNAFLRIAGVYHFEQTYCTLDVEVFKSKEPAGIIDQRQLSDKIMSLYNGSGVCFRALSWFIGLLHEMGVTSVRYGRNFGNTRWWIDGMRNSIHTAGCTKIVQKVCQHNFLLLVGHLAFCELTHRITTWMIYVLFLHNLHKLDSSVPAGHESNYPLLVRAWILYPQPLLQ